MFDLGKNLFKHKAGNQEHSLKAASLEPKRFMYLYLRLRAAERVAEMRARDWLLLWAAVENAHIWAQPNYILWSPVAGLMQSEPLISLDEPCAMCEQPRTPQPPLYRHHQGWKSCQSRWLLWFWCSLGLVTTTHKTSDDCEKHIMYSTQETIKRRHSDDAGSNGSCSVVFQSGAGVLCQRRRGKWFWIWYVNDKISWSCVRNQFQQIILKRDSSKQ